MTRAALSLALAALTLGVGLWTCVVACWNHQRADNLARLQRRFDMQRAANAQLEARAAAHVWGVDDEAAAREAVTPRLELPEVAP